MLLSLKILTQRILLSSLFIGSEIKINKGNSKDSKRIIRNVSIAADPKVQEKRDLPRVYYKALKKR